LPSSVWPIVLEWAASDPLCLCLGHLLEPDPVLSSRQPDSIPIFRLLRPH
jgi:hypothetical protein